MHVTHIDPRRILTAAMAAVVLALVAAALLGSRESAAPARDVRSRDTVSNAAAAAGTREPRVVVMLFDDVSFGTLEGRTLAEAASRFAAQVPAGDLVAALSVSGMGPQGQMYTHRVLISINVNGAEDDAAGVADAAELLLLVTVPPSTD